MKTTNIEPKNKEPLSPMKILAGDQLKTKKPRLIAHKNHKQVDSIFSLIRKKNNPETRENMALLVATNPSAPSMKLNVLINQIEPKRKRNEISKLLYPSSFSIHI